MLVEEALNWGYLKILFARREQHELSLRYWCKQIWSIIITFLWWQSSSTRSRLVGSVTVHSIHLKNTWFAFLMEVHSAQLHGPIWTPQVCNNQHYKWKICCKNQRETVKGSEQIWRKLKLMDDDWRWEEHTLIQQKFRRQIHLLLSGTSSTFPFNC
jgi:hypothetical protein